MNRKLHNTLTALLASSSLLVLGLVAGRPVATTPSPTTPAIASIAAIEEQAAADAATDAVDAGKRTEPSASQRHGLRGKRHSVAMPFFSFTPRG